MTLKLNDKQQVLLAYLLSLFRIAKSVFLLCVCPEHSMAETLSVALRVAEEAIDEAISKAEVAASCQVICALLGSQRILLFISLTHFKWSV